MSPFIALLESAIWSDQVTQRLAWALLHFLWQGIAIAAILHLVLRLAKSACSATRYALCLLGLIGMAACPIVTMTCFDPVPTAWAIQKDSAVMGDMDRGSERSSNYANLSLEMIPFEKQISELPREGFLPQDTSDEEDFLLLREGSSVAFDSAEDPAAPVGEPAPESHVLGKHASIWIVGIWIVGVALFSVRLLLGWAGVWRLRRRVDPVPDWIVARVQQLSGVMRVTAPLIRSSGRVSEAIAVGFLKPMILLPASWITELPPDMLEAIIAHELAHIRRGDLWVNLFQRVVETLLFYHPVVWWLSHRIRVERELCCDALVVATTQNPVRYAETLEHVGRLCFSNSPAGSVSAAGARQALTVSSVGTRRVLLGRIQAILNVPSLERTSPSWSAALISMVIVNLIVILLIRGPAPANESPVLPQKATVVSIEPEGSRLIVPGERVGEYRIGQTTLAELFGSDTPFVENPKKQEMAKLGLYFEFNRGREVTAIHVSNPDFKTAEGVGPGTDLDTLLKTFPNLRLVKTKNQKLALQYYVVPKVPGIQYYPNDGKLGVIRVFAKRMVEDEEINSKEDHKSLRGRVVDETAAPISGVTVELYKDRSHRLVRGQKTVTDSNGEYSFDKLLQWRDDPPRTGYFTEVRFEHDKYVPVDGQLWHSWRKQRLKAEDQFLDTLNLEMTAGGKVTGVVVDDQTGQAMPNLKLRVLDGFVNGKRRNDYMAIVRTDDEGRFTSSSLFPGLYHIEIDGDGLFANPILGRKIGKVTIKAGQTQVVSLTTAARLDLQDPFIIEGTAVATDGEPIVDGQLTLKTSSDQTKLRNPYWHFSNHHGDANLSAPNQFRMQFGPLERGEMSAASTHGVGEVDIQLTGISDRQGYKLLRREPAEPLRLTDDPAKAELENGIRYVRPGKPVKLKLIFARADDVDNTRTAGSLIVKVQDKDGQPVPFAEVRVFDPSKRSDQPLPMQLQLLRGTTNSLGLATFSLDQIPTDVPYQITVSGTSTPSGYRLTSNSALIASEQQLNADPLIVVQKKDDDGNLTVIFTQRVGCNFFFDVTDSTMNERVEFPSVFFQDDRVTDWTLLTSSDATTGQRNFTTIVEEMSEANYRAVRQGYFPREFKLEKPLKKQFPQQRPQPLEGQRVHLDPAPLIQLTVLQPDGQPAAGAKVKYLGPANGQRGSHTPESPTDASGQTTFKYPGHGDLVRYEVTHASGKATIAVKDFAAPAKTNPQQAGNKGGAESVQVQVQLSASTGRSNSLSGRFAIGDKAAIKEMKPGNLEISPFIRSKGNKRKFTVPERQRWIDLGIPDESLVIGEDGGMANVVVWALDVPEITDWNGPLPLSTMQARDGRFQPHVLPFCNWASLKLVNEMPENVNFNLSGALGTPRNVMLTQRGRQRARATLGPEYEFEMAEERIPVPLISNLHPWMKSYVLPLSHPCFAVTDKSGRFEIKHLPLGEFEFAIWHERVGWLKTEKFPTGRFKFNVTDDGNTIGDVKVEPAAFKKQVRATTDPETETATFFPRDPYSELGIVREAGDGWHFLRVAGHPPAAKDLGISTEQQQAIKALFDVHLEQDRQLEAKLRQEHGSLPHKLWITQRSEHWAAGELAARKLLNDAQVQRVGQVMLLRQSFHVFSFPRVQSWLNLSKQQSADIQAQIKLHYQRRGRESLRRLGNEIQKILTAKQRSQFDEMRGLALLENRTAMRGFAQTIKPLLPKGWSVASNDYEVTIRRDKEVLSVPLYGRPMSMQNETTAEYHERIGFRSALDVTLRFVPRLTPESYRNLSNQQATLLERGKNGFRSKTELSKHSRAVQRYQLPAYETPSHSVFRLVLPAQDEMYDDLAKQELDDVLQKINQSLPSNRGTASAARSNIPWNQDWIALVWQASTADEAAKFDGADFACKLKMGPITESHVGSPAGTLCEATCDVISPLKGKLEPQIKIRFRRGGNGIFRLGDPIYHAGGVYLVLLKGESEPFQIFGAMRGLEEVVEPRFGTSPVDRLLAEMVAMYETSDPAKINSAVRQIGLLRDLRGIEQVNAAAQSKHDHTARTAIIAQYRMRIPPDANRTMELFDQRIMDVWYEESGRPLLDTKGKSLRRTGSNGVIRLRGVPGFDYATYIREGVKKDWVRKDDRMLYRFFGTPWKVQRVACIPELMKLLDHPDQKIRYWGVECLTHTVEDKDFPGWEKFQQSEAELLNKWRVWWRDEGAAYMSRGDHPATGATKQRQPKTEKPDASVDINVLAGQEHVRFTRILKIPGATSGGVQDAVASFGAFYLAGKKWSKEENKERLWIWQVNQAGEKAWDRTLATQARVEELAIVGLLPSIQKRSAAAPMYGIRVVYTQGTKTRLAYVDGDGIVTSELEFPWRDRADGVLELDDGDLLLFGSSMLDTRKKMRGWVARTNPRGSEVRWKHDFHPEPPVGQDDDKPAEQEFRRKTGLYEQTVLGSGTLLNDQSIVLVGQTGVYSNFGVGQSKLWLLRIDVDGKKLAEAFVDDAYMERVIRRPPVARPTEVVVRYWKSRINREAVDDQGKPVPVMWPWLTRFDHQLQPISESDLTKSLQPSTVTLGSWRPNILPVQGGAEVLIRWANDRGKETQSVRVGSPESWITPLNTVAHGDDLLSVSNWRPSGTTADEDQQHVLLVFLKPLR